MRLPDEIRARFRRHGRRGGRVRARRLSPEARRILARSAAVRRWIRARFGEPRFALLGLPGGARIDEGLDDLSAGRETVASLLVALAAPRLRRERVPVPRIEFPDPDRRLYRLLQATDGALAHSRFRALRREVVSFADACAFLRTRGGRHAR